MRRNELDDDFHKINLELMVAGLEVMPSKRFRRYLLGYFSHSGGVIFHSFEGFAIRD